MLTLARHHHARTSARARVQAARPDGTRPDEGSLLMALLFTMMVSALCIAIMVSVMTGLKKADNTRAFALSQQAADIALADALMHANLRLLTTSPATNDGVTGSGTSTVNWNWTATQTSQSVWIIDVEARGKSVDRHFRATLTRTPVIQGTWSDTNDDGIRDNIRYTAKNSRPFGSGFYGVNGVYFSPNGGGTSSVDGYNGGRGVLGTSGNTDLAGVPLDIINLWNYKTTDTFSGRCVDCIDYYTGKVRQFEQDFQRDPVTPCTGSRQNIDWTASSGIRLKNGDCYNSLTFDVDYNFAPATATEQAWIASRSDVTINPGINVGVNRTTVFTKATSWVIQIGAGEFTLDNNAMFSGAVYNPSGVCNVVGSAAAQSTTWLGASVCSDIDATGTFRLRYDGAMTNVERPGDTTTGPGVWNLRDFQIID